MEDEKNTQLSLEFGKKAATTDEPSAEESFVGSVKVFSFSNKKAERDRAEELKLYEKILRLVKHF